VIRALSIFRRLPFLRCETGSASISFVLVFPVFMTIFLSTVEVAMMTLRHTMLERAVSLTVRDLRLGSFTSLTREDLQKNICKIASLIPDCFENIVIDLQTVDKKTWTMPAPGAACKNTDSKIRPATKFTPGIANELVIIRVCVGVKPYFPTTGLGLQMRKNNESGYFLVAGSAFVNEP
jgi:Flp pilus assembly protein TadG